MNTHACVRGDMTEYVTIICNAVVFNVFSLKIKLNKYQISYEDGYRLNRLKRQTGFIREKKKKTLNTRVLGARIILLVKLDSIM